MTPTRTAVLLLSAVLPACLDASPRPDVGRTRNEVNVDVVWHNAANVSINGNDMTKTTGGSSWNAGAVSEQTLGRWGFVKFTTGETNTTKMLGLSRTAYGDSDQSDGDVDYGLKLGDDGSVTAWVMGSQITGSTTYAANDVFYIESTPTTIYFRKGHIAATAFAQASVGTEIFPLEVDTSLCHVGATLLNVDIHPTVIVAPQATFYDEAGLDCASANAITINGAIFKQIGTPGVDSFYDFSLTTPQSVANRLDTFAENALGITDTSTVTGIIIMDIENPHLSDLWGTVAEGERDIEEQDEIILGFRNRIEGTRMAFPNATLGLYGTLVPDGNGELTPVFQNQLEALQRAGDEELYDDVDYLIPVLYPRFGCDAPSSNPVVCDTHFDTIDEMTSMGIVQSRTLKTSDGSTVPLLPLVTVRVRNGNSNFNGELLMDLGVANDIPNNPFADTLNVQMNLFRTASPPVRDVVLWVENIDTNILNEENNGPGPGWSVDHYTCWM